MGQSDHGFQLGQVDVHFFIIFRVRVGKQGLIVFLALLRLQEAAGRFVAGEHGGRCAQFRAHIGNGGAFGDRQAFHALAGVFHHLAHAALDGQAAQQLQNHVLCGHTPGQFPGQVNIDHLGAVQVIRAAAHGHGHVQSARANGQHSQRAACGGMAIAAQQRPARLAHPFQLHLMTDTVAGLTQIDTVLFRHGGNILMVVGVFEARLQGIMVDIRHAAFRFHPIHAHSLQLQVGHGSRRVLRQGLIDSNSDFLARHQLAFEQVIF